MAEERALMIEQSTSYIIAPISGYITTLAVKTDQSFLKTGDLLCVITPKEEIISEMYIPAKDIGFIGKGLPISYQIDAFPFQEWGYANGTVQNISQDYVVSPQDAQSGTANFKVIGNFYTDSLVSSRQAKAVKLSAGLTYRASIIVAQKRLAEILWDKSVRYFVL
jgi:membrane fusion protein, peptide pheromone/bacteriocin exporter